MNPIVISFRLDGSANCVHTEAFDLESLGELSIRRASEVEFNDQTQLWEVRWAGDKKVVFCHPSRSECVGWEVGQLNSGICSNG